ncbi:ABC transporter permease [Mesorhizobium sp. M4B.F.Ca.ET.089.01.1.1]|uniref:Spermidine/putrescine transport system permease protein PotC n=2 Tax=Mesorhizobium abyssinicae TaxID=1209958 RepID=A0ABU5AMY5_9HYPH|nr:MULTISPECIES: ABC transporter permease [Mesorhizobium]MDX8538609.1 ABC transporter permease [Mesorhizobium abyssinicae]RWX71079.1 ABC transporter permease [Mesorhizobium sp. M4B.F.Ca.ET.089.01.1.1]
MAASQHAFDLKAQPGFSIIARSAIVALYLPILILVVFAFNATSSLGVWGGFSFDWFVKAWHNDLIINAALFSLFLATVAGVLATVMATMAAIAMTRTDAYRGQLVSYALINQPLIVPEIVTAISLLIVFAAVKSATGYSGTGYLVLAHTAFCIPFAYLPIRARLEGMDLTLETAAADLYADPWKAFLHVTLPRLAPGIVAGFMLAFVISLDDVVITDLVKSGGQETLPTYMLGQIRRDMTPEVNAAATMLLVPSILLVTAVHLINRKK